jgi:hypothetical protein
MEIGAKELRARPGKIIEQAARGINEAFGIWTDRVDLDVAAHVRELRSGRLT